MTFSWGPDKCQYLQVFSPEASVLPEQAISPLTCGAEAWCQGAGTETEKRAGELRNGVSALRTQTSPPAAWKPIPTLLCTVSSGRKNPLPSITCCVGLKRRGCLTVGWKGEEGEGSHGSFYRVFKKLSSVPASLLLFTVLVFPIPNDSVRHFLQHTEAVSLLW